MLIWLLLQGIPYRLYTGSEVRFIVHLSLCGLGFLLAVITFIVQLASPAPYGKHENKVPSLSLSLSLLIHLSVYVSFCLSNCMSVYLSLSLFVCFCLL